MQCTIPNESQIPLWQQTDPRTSSLIFGNVVVPWPKSYVFPFAVRDYRTCDHQFLMSCLRARKIVLPGKVKKIDAVTALEEWDEELDNRTLIEKDHDL